VTAAAPPLVGASARRSPLPVLVLAVLTVATAQQVLVPVLAPLARDVGLSELAMGLVITTSALVFSLTSPLWGRTVDVWGHRRVMLSGLVLCLLGLLAFGAVAELAVRDQIGPTATLVLFLTTRCVLFGAGMGAVPAAAMSYVAATTSTEQRVAGLSRIGAVQGLATALGPALGALLAFAGLLGPVWAAPVLITVVLALVALRMPPPASYGVALPDGAAGRAAAKAGRAPGLKPWDPRLRPVLLVGFGMFLMLGMVMISLGFLVQDRLGVEGAEAVRAAGTVSGASGVVMVLTQALVVPRLRWAPWRLMRTGVPVAALGVLLLVPADSLLALCAASATMSLGVGVAAPGYTSAPTMLVGPEEQGGVAGLVQGVTGATFVLGPLLGSGLYGLAPEVPLLVAGGVCATGAVFVWSRPGPVPAPAATA